MLLKSQTSHVDDCLRLLGSKAAICMEMLHCAKCLMYTCDISNRWGNACRLVANLGPITDPEVIHALERRGADKEWARKKQVPSERQVTQVHWWQGTPKLLRLLWMSIDHISRGCVSVCATQVYAALKQRHPQSYTAEQLSGLLADLKVMISLLPLLWYQHLLHVPWATTIYLGPSLFTIRLWKGAMYSAGAWLDKRGAVAGCQSETSGTRCSSSGSSIPLHRA